MGCSVRVTYIDPAWFDFIEWYKDEDWEDYSYYDDEPVLHLTRWDDESEKIARNMGLWG